MTTTTELCWMLMISFNIVTYLNLMQCQEVKNAHEIDHSHRTMDDDAVVKSGGLIAGEDDPYEEGDESDDDLDMDDELVPKWLNNKFERQMMSKLGKKVYPKMKKSKRLVNQYNKPGSSSFFNRSSSPLLQTRRDDSVHKVVKNFERCFRCQAELDWLWYGIPSSGEKRCLNFKLWHAYVGPLVSLPTVGSRVVYFPQGHREQDFTQQPPAQELITRDYMIMNGNSDIYFVPKRHLLTTGWSAFVSAKSLLLVIWSYSYDIRLNQRLKWVKASYIKGRRDDNIGSWCLFAFPHEFLTVLKQSNNFRLITPFKRETFESIDVDVSDSDSWQLIDSDDGNFSYGDVTTTDDDDNDGVVLDVDDLVQHRYVSQSYAVSVKNAHEIDHSHRTMDDDAVVKSGGLIAGEDDPYEEGDESDDDLDMDDELVPKWLNNKFERQMMTSSFFNRSSSPLLQTRRDDSVHKVVKNFERCFRCQAELDWLWYGIPSSGEKRCLNFKLWHAYVGPLVSLPTVGSRVVYFPQGHREQDFTQQPPAQELITRDYMIMNGNSDIYFVPKRHLLTTGWSAFVSAKSLLLVIWSYSYDIRLNQRLKWVKASYIKGRRDDNIGSWCLFAFPHEFLTVLKQSNNFRLITPFKRHESRSLACGRFTTKSVGSRKFATKRFSRRKYTIRRGSSRRYTTKRFSSRRFT
ncbi:hypothetical protein QVD17_06912 [Tagetes erecta]|uniref:Uncharacterized protein n=1 Tax=Tagetes erecta TaxID=13708 RepID=A0AAD8P6Z1_TARER|nr:hypothetical protein QVD17_06912 [Tagetes erecta]